MINRYRNAILLSAIGDALGWITEFEKNTASLRNKYGTEYIDSFQPWKKPVGGRFNGYMDEIRSGSYSDDTQLLLSVARSIKSNGKLDHHYFSKIELPQWLNYARGAGRTVKNAAKKISRKSATWNNNFFKFNVGKTSVDYRDSGANGVAMRILPIALANRNNLEVIKDEIFANGIVTHGHPRALIGAVLYGFAIDRMTSYTIKSFTYQSYLTDLGKNLNEKFDSKFLNNSYYKNWLINWNNSNNDNNFLTEYNNTIDEVLEGLRNIFRFVRDDKNDFEVLKELGCFNQATKGSGISTVLAGIFLSIKYFDNLELAITTAVNSIGSDTDSIAAFAGGLCGVLNEHDCIPKEWLSVQDQEYLIKISDDIFKISNSQNNIEEFVMNALQTSEILNIEKDNYSINQLVNYEPLGRGIITKIDRQKTLTSGKYNLILDISFEIGQTCKFSKFLDIEKNNASSYFEEK